MDHGEAEPGGVVLGQLRLDILGTAHQDDLHAQFSSGDGRPLHDDGRGVVTAHGIQGYPRGGLGQR